MTAYSTRTSTPDKNENSAVISAAGIGKRYILYDKPQDRLMHALSWRFGRTYGRPFWALRNISFDVQRGETLGLLGRNGSGKSTLLQIIAGILQPTTGAINIRGRVAALLELGSGFNPEYSGRENVYVNGALLGLSREEIETRFDAIAAFADIGAFIDQPVKLYSSGMFARLAFAVVSHVDPDILLVDEALSVGDIRFQRKCLRRMNKIVDEGATVVFVSHDLHTLERFCSRAIVLESGELKADAGSHVATAYYQNMLLDTDAPTPSEDDPERTESRYATGEVTFKDLDLCGDEGNPKHTYYTGEELHLTMRYTARQPISRLYAGVSIWSDDEIRVGQAHMVFESADPHPDEVNGDFIVKCRVKRNPLLPGRYFLRGGVYDEQLQFAFCLWGWTGDRIGEFTILSQPVNGFVLKGDLGFVKIASDWELTSSTTGSEVTQ